MSAAPLADLVQPAVARLQQEKHYAPFYPAMLAGVRAICQAQSQAPLTAIAHLAYGWMPTILKSVTCDDETEQTLVKRVQGVQDLQQARDLITGLSKVAPVNRSWVGTSKTFHFINPQFFPIWDSRVARHFGKTYAAAVNTRDAYLSYFDYVVAARNAPEVQVMKDALAQPDQWNQDVSDVRALELILFMSSHIADTKPCYKAKTAK